MKVSSLPRHEFLRRSAFFAALTLVQIFVARRGLTASPLADIDSVCHVAYVEYFRNVFWPATHAIVGYTPDYNLGAPFLLYNVPPGVTLAGTALTWLGLSAPMAIKTLLYVAWLAVPYLGFFLTEALLQFETTERSPVAAAPYFAAIALALFSSDLFGLEFFLHNGMVNACLGLPLTLATLLATTYALRDPARVLVRPALTATALFATLVVTHVLSAYFCALGLACLVFCGRFTSMGIRATTAALVLVLGGALAAWWIVPSVPFAPDHESSFNWIRGAKDTVSAFFDGSAIASVFDGFDPRYRRESNVGLVAVLPGIVGFVEAWRRRSPGMRIVAVFWLLCFAVALGPHPTFGLGWLPGYPRLLWYRFMTPAVAAWLVLAGFGVACLREYATRISTGKRVAVDAALVLGATLALGVLAEAGAKVETLDAYETFVADYSHVFAWLRAHGDRNGRVFGEFLSASETPVPSVNFLRQRLPIDSGIPEVAGWVYENSEASSRLVERGMLWWGASLYADESERLDVRYVVANNPATIRSFSADARWESVVRRPSLVLFAAKAGKPALFSAGPSGQQARAVVVNAHEALAGGGYRYRLQVAQGAGNILARVSFSRAWRATVNGISVAPLRTNDALVEVPLSSEASDVELTWSVDELATRGQRISLAGLLLWLVGLATTLRIKAVALPAAMTAVARGGVVVVLAGLIARGQRQRVDDVHFGPAHGVETHSPGTSLALGTLHELDDGAFIRVEPGAFAPAVLVGNTPSRFALPDAHVHLRAYAQPNATFSLHTIGTSVIVVQAVDARDPAAPCIRKVASGERFTFPDGCASGSDEAHPGLHFALHVESASPIAELRIDDGLQLVEAEAFANVSDDGDYDALPWHGVRGNPLNGMVQAAIARRGGEVRTRWHSTLPAGTYRAWMLTNFVAKKHGNERADFALRLGSREVGRIDVVDESIDDHESEWNEHPGWRAMGTVTVSPGDALDVAWIRRPGSKNGFGAWDAMAFEPDGSGQR